MCSVWQEMLSFVHLLTRSQSVGDNFGVFPWSWEDKCSAPRSCAAPITNIITPALFAREDLLQRRVWSMSVHGDPPTPPLHLLYTDLSLSARLLLILSCFFLHTAHIYRIAFFYKKVKSAARPNVCHSSVWWAAMAQNTPLTEIWIIAHTAMLDGF